MKYLAEPGVECGKPLGVFLFLRLESGILFTGSKPGLFAASRVRLSHAVSIVTRANRRRQIIPAHGCVLEPRPTKKRRGRRRGRERLARKKLTRRSEFTSINRNRRIRFKMEPFLGRLLNRHVAYGLHL